MDKSEKPFDRDQLEALNAKTLQNEFFTPDDVYIELSLMKDFPIGVVYADAMNKDETGALFREIQTAILPHIEQYQKRMYDTVTPFFGTLGYNDETIEHLLAGGVTHDHVFLVSPSTKFLYTLIRATARNQNHSGPANKFNKRSLNTNQYVLDVIPITYHFNTFPLTISSSILEKMATELGEALGVNIRFLNKDPSLFDEKDWDTWLKEIDCFYLDSFGRFNRSAFLLQKQSDMEFMGRYIFARKRFETRVMAANRNVDFDQQIQMITARQGMMCDFVWLQNNEARLTDTAEDVPMDLSDPLSDELKQGITA